MNLSPTQRTVAAWTGIAAAALWLLWALGPVLTPFVVAAVLAYALAPLVDRLLRAGHGRLSRAVAVLLVEALALLALAGVLLLIVPVIVREVPLLREQVPVLFEALNGWLAPLLARAGIEFTFDVASIKGFVRNYLDANVEALARRVLESIQLGGSVALAVLGNLVLVPVALFYLLLDWPQLVERLRGFVPVPARAAFESFTSEADAVLGQYLRGQLLVMLIMAVFFSAGLALFGLDLALPIGIFTGLAMFVPYLGFGLGLVLALLAGLLEFASMKAVWMVAVVYGLGQLVESLYLTPRLVGERIGLHPLAAIFALLAFGQLFGFVGVLVALPASAVGVVALRRLRDAYLASGLYRG